MTAAAADYGFGTQASAAQNGLAVSLASQAVGSGGVVTLPPGEFSIVGGTLDRNTTLRIEPSTTLVGLAPGESEDDYDLVNMVTNRTAGITCSATGRSVTVAATSGLRVGDVVSINDAGALFDGQRKALLARVASIESSTALTIDTDVVVSVSGVTMNYGHGNVHVIGGGTLNGNKGPTDGPNYFPVRFTFAHDSTVNGVSIINGDHGGVFITSSIGCSVLDCTITDNNNGSGVWVFGGSTDCTISGNVISGGYHGVTLDDRTVGANITDGVVLRSVVTGNTISGCEQDGVAIEGASDSAISGNTITGCDRGVNIVNSAQGVAEFVLSENNVVTGNTITGCATGLRLAGVNTTQSGNTFTSCTTNIADTE